MKDNINNTIKDTKKATLSIFDSLLEIIAHIILHASATKRKFIHKIGSALLKAKGFIAKARFEMTE